MAAVRPPFTQEGESVCIPLFCFPTSDFLPGSRLKGTELFVNLSAAFSRVHSLKMQIKTASLEGAHTTS